MSAVACSRYVENRAEAKECFGMLVPWTKEQTDKTRLFPDCDGYVTTTEGNKDEKRLHGERG